MARAVLYRDHGRHRGLCRHGDDDQAPVGSPGDIVRRRLQLSQQGQREQVNCAGRLSVSSVEPSLRLSRSTRQSCVMRNLRKYQFLGRQTERSCCCSQPAIFAAAASAAAAGAWTPPAASALADGCSTRKGHSRLRDTPFPSSGTLTRNTARLLAASKDLGKTHRVRHAVCMVHSPALSPATAAAAAATAAKGLPGPAGPGI